MGDDVQSIKAGMLEIADLFVVNKADREGADQVVRQLRAMLHLAMPEVDAWEVPVLKAVAMQQQGSTEIIAALVQHRDYLVRSGHGQRRAFAAAERELSAAVQELILERVQGPRWQALIDALAARQIDPYSAALELLQKQNL
jgi:LAO/AO transport system kinase